MRSQVQVLAGSPAKALPERPPATPLDHLGPLGPAPAPTASVLAPPVRPPRGPGIPAGSPATRSFGLASAAAAGRVSAGRGPGWLIGRVPPDRTWPGEPGSAAPAPKRPHSQEHTAHQQHHHKDHPDRFQRRHRATRERTRSTCVIGVNHHTPADQGASTSATAGW
jgi:hypothetical protein